MAIITPGQGNAPKGTTAETQLINTFILLRIWENTPELNPGDKRYVSGSFSISDFTFRGTFELPCAQEIDAEGKPRLIGINYLTGSFSPGQPTGTFKSLNLPAYFIEVFTYCQLLEANPTKNLANKNYLIASYDSDEQVLRGTIQLDFFIDSTVGDSTSISILEYLETA